VEPAIAFLDVLCQALGGIADVGLLSSASRSALRAALRVTAVPAIRGVTARSGTGPDVVGMVIVICRCSARWRAGSYGTPSCQQRHTMRDHARPTVRKARGWSHAGRRPAQTTTRRLGRCTKCPMGNVQRAAAYIVLVMSARVHQDRVIVALAAVTCGRLSRAATVRAGWGQCSAAADQHRVKVTEPRSGSVVAGRPIGEHSPEVVLEHWGGDAEMLTLLSQVTGAVGPSGPLERARVAARTVNYYDLDSLQIAYPDGAALLAGRIELVLYGPRRGFLRRRDRLLHASVKELL
jgi:hypothetical protein